jgi:protease II
MLVWLLQNNQIKRRIFYLCFLITSVTCTLKYRLYEYPKTERIPVSDTLHNKVIIDDYRWCESSEEPRVQAWLVKQESITHSVIDKLPQRKWLIGRFTTLWRYDDERTPRKVLGSTRIFFWATKKEWERWAYYYRETDSAPAILLLNPNQCCS